MMDLIITAALVTAGAQAAAAAPAAPTPVTVNVGLGPAVAARMHDLGASELQDEEVLLAREVQAALASTGAKSARLAIVDIEPNRPTIAQLGRSRGLRAESLNLGGAAIQGEVTEADGRIRPVRFRFFYREFYQVPDFAIWGGAQTAFGRLALKLRHGDVPYDSSSWAAPQARDTPTGSLIPG